MGDIAYVFCAKNLGSRCGTSRPPVSRSRVNAVTKNISFQSAGSLDFETKGVIPSIYHLHSLAVFTIRI